MIRFRGSKLTVSPKTDAPIRQEGSAGFTPRRYAFADLVLDVGARRLLRDGEPVRLPKLSFDFLRVLVEAAPNAMSPDALSREVWGPKRVVTPENLNQRLLMLRQSLGDSAAHPRYVESLRGQGCRMIPDVAALPSRNDAERERPAAAGRRVLAGWLGGLAALAVAGIVAMSLPGHEGAPAGSSVGAVPAGAGAGAGTRARLAHSVAVLPFDALDAGAATSVFSDALHAEVINALGTSSELNVIARASVLHYRDSRLPVPRIAGALGVEAVATGMVRETARGLRLTAELLDAESGVQLWAADYDTTLDALYSVRLDVATNIANALSAPISAVDEARLAALETSPEATAFYLRAMDVFGSNTLGSRTTARTYLDQAIALDADFAHAHAGADRRLFDRQRRRRRRRPRRDDRRARKARP